MIYDSIIVTGSAQVSGSLSVTGGITGSLQGTASYAVTASYSFNAVSASYALTASYLTGYVSPFPYTGSAIISGSLIVTGSTTSTLGFTGSLSGTASYATTASYANNSTSASYAVTASYSDTSTSASYALTASYANNATTSQTASYILNAVSASYAITASYANNSTSASYSISASHADSAISASYATTASYANNATNAQTASYILNAVSASYALTASYSNNSTSASYAISASHSDSSISASYALSASYANNATTSQTASYVLNAVSASYALTASYANNSTTASYAITASYADSATSASYSLTASYANIATNAQTASYVLNAVSASYALTASYANTSTSASYSTTASYALTASSADDFLVRGTLTAQTIVVQTITSSIDFVTGSTRFGSLIDNTHIFTGSISVSGSITVGNDVINNLTASNATSASYANNATSASYALTASYANNSTSASYTNNSTSASYSNSSTSASYALTASHAINGGVTQILAGANVTIAPTNGQGQVTISATGGGGSNFNTATGSYGSFYDTTTQTNVAGTARSMSFNTIDITNGVSISGSTNPFNTYIKTENAGVYDIQFSAQVDKTDSGTDEIWIWLRKNGTNLTDTATSVQLTGNGDHYVAAWNFFVNSAANDYYQLMWYSPDANVRLHAEPGFGVVPGIPSVIATVNRVDQFLSNTGSFSGSFNGNFTGSLLGTASYATTASYANNSTSASYAVTASYANNSTSASYALTASYLTGYVSPFPYTGSALITGSLGITGSLSIKDIASNFSIVGNGFGQSSLISPDGAIVLTPGLYGVQINGAFPDLKVNGNITTDGYVASNAAGSYLTGSLFGTSSYAINALTASYVANASSFPFTGSALITGSLGVTGSISIQGSGSNLFTVDGTLGRMFTIDDTVSGSLLSVNTGSLAILEVFSDKKINMSGSVTITGSLNVITSITGSLLGTSSYAITASYALNSTPSVPSTSVRNIQKFTATSGQTSFTISGGYNVGLVDVYVNGVKLDNSGDFTATNGTTVVLTVGAMLDDIVEVYNYVSAFTANNALRVVTPFTATAAQTTFSASYTPGFIDVFYNGSKLAASEYTASNGVSITLGTAAQLNDIVEVTAYSYTVGAFTGIGGSGTANYVAKFTSGSTIGTSSIYDSGSNVGINTINPIYTLDVSGSARFTNSATITGSLNVSGSNTLIGTKTITGSVFISGSKTVIGTNTITGSLNVSGSITSTGTLTAQTLVVQTITSSVLYSSGSNIFGNALSNTQVMTGSVGITGSLAVAGTGTFSGQINSTVGNNGALLSATTATTGYQYIDIITTSGRTQLIQESSVAGTTVTNSTAYASMFGSAVAKDLILFTNGAARITISGSNGNVGIGTTAPAGKLDVYVGSYQNLIFKAESANQSSLRFNESTNGPRLYSDAGTEEFRMQQSYTGTGFLTFYTGPTERMRITPSGSVGIGTNSPSSLLTVNGTSANTESGQIKIIKTGANERTLHIGYNTTSDYAYLNAYKAGIGYKPIVLNPDGGNVGIGTTSPLSKLDISVGNQTSLGLFSASGTSITSAGGSTGNLYQISFGYGGGTYGSSTIAGLTESSTGYNTGALIFATRALTTDSAPIERMRITSGGNVGIGTTSPKLGLHTNRGASSAPATSGTTANGIAMFTPSDGTNALMIGAYGTSPYANWIQSSDYNNFATSFPLALQPNGGNVGIGTTSPSQKLEVVGGEIKAGRVDSSSEGGQVSFGRASDNATGWYIDVYGNTSTPDLRFVDVSNSAVRMSITSAGNVYLGDGFSSNNHRINKKVAQGSTILVISGYDTAANDTAYFYSSDGTSPNGAATAIGVMRNSSTSRSINASGTINASGADYAEYMTKIVNDVINKGDIVGVNTDGKLTNIFNDAKSFVVKSTDPSYVGGDIWGNEDTIGKKPQQTTDQTDEEFAPILAAFEAKLEIERAKVDRISFSGQVPCNVTGATVGDYIIPIQLENGKISGQAVTNPTFEQYQISVGKVWKIMEDGRAWIAVKIG
jgi:hypothetical protein